MVTKIEIRVGLKTGMADPEGANVQKALHLLGFDNIDKVESAKCYRIIIDKEKEAALEIAEKMCQQLLANPVVHKYTISVAD
ncbi:phosphoribosylformylglycinamidine synthase subunit PurS [Euryarchaeota archaeon]|jgi:phosphoribosylformylglycinamidine synthase subunit PurS|nr:phosphoribosylformylglycinamidine synthase subunit PurS [Euryarchaeota archaeon]